MLLLQTLVFSINRKGRGNGLRTWTAAVQRENCAALEGNFWALWGSVYCIPWCLSFRKPGCPVSRFTHTLERPFFLDKTQGFPAKSRNPLRLCSDNHLKVKENFSGCCWGKRNSKPAMKSLGYSNSQSQVLTVKIDVLCELYTENPYLHTTVVLKCHGNHMSLPKKDNDLS